jgi:hypothetical protein
LQYCRKQSDSILVLRSDAQRAPPGRDGTQPYSIVLCCRSLVCGIELVATRPLRRHRYAWHHRSSKKMAAETRQQLVELRLHSVAGLPPSDPTVVCEVGWL